MRLRRLTRAALAQGSTTPELESAAGSTCRPSPTSSTCRSSSPSWPSAPCGRAPGHSSWWGLSWESSRRRRSRSPSRGCIRSRWPSRRVGNTARDQGGCDATWRSRSAHNLGDSRGPRHHAEPGGPGNSQAPGDPRQRLTLPPQARDKVLAEMRHMLESVNGILRGVAANDLVAVEKAARAAGTVMAVEIDSAMMRHSCPPFASSGCRPTGHSTTWHTDQGRGHARRRHPGAGRGDGELCGLPCPVPARRGAVGQGAPAGRPSWHRCCPARPCRARAARLSAVRADRRRPRSWSGRRSGPGRRAAPLGRRPGVGRVVWLHADLQAFGFFGTLIVGVAHHLVPRFAGRPVAATPLTPWLAGAPGTALGWRISGAIAGVAVLAVAAVLLQALAFGLFAAGVMRALGAPHLRLTRTYLTTATAWLVLALVVEAGLRARVLAQPRFRRRPRPRRDGGGARDGDLRGRSDGSWASSSGPGRCMFPIASARCPGPDGSGGTRPGRRPAGVGFAGPWSGGTWWRSSGPGRRSFSRRWGWSRCAAAPSEAPRAPCRWQPAAGRRPGSPHGDAGGERCCGGVDRRGCRGVDRDSLEPYR